MFICISHGFLCVIITNVIIEAGLKKTQHCDQVVFKPWPFDMEHRTLSLSLLHIPKLFFLPNLHKSMQLCFAPFDYRHLEEQLMERSLVQLENGIKPLSSVMSKLETLQFGHFSWPNSKILFYSTPLVDDCVESSHLPD